MIAMSCCRQMQENKRGLWLISASPARSMSNSTAGLSRKA